MAYGHTFGQHSVGPAQGEEPLAYGSPRRLRARDPSDLRIMRARPTQYSRAVVIAHLWQRKTHKSVLHSDIQSWTAPSKLAHLWQRDSPTCGREKPTNRFVTPTFSSGVGSRRSSTLTACCDSFCLEDFRSFRFHPAPDFFFGFRVLVPVNSPTCGREKPTHQFLSS